MSKMSELDIMVQNAVAEKLEAIREEALGVFPRGTVGADEIFQIFENNMDELSMSTKGE